MTIDVLLGTGVPASIDDNFLLNPGTVKVCIFAIIGAAVIGSIEVIKANGDAGLMLLERVQRIKCGN